MALFCIPKTPLTLAIARFFSMGTILSVLLAIVFSVYLVLEIHTNEQLLDLNNKLNTLRLTGDTKQQIDEQIQLFADELQRNVHSYNRNFALYKEGAHIETFYGIEMDQHNRFIRDIRYLLGFRHSLACNLLQSGLDSQQYLQFKGDKAGVVIRLGQPISITKIKYEHVITDTRNSRLRMASPKEMHFYGYRNTTEEPEFLGKSSLQINKNSNYQQMILNVDPFDFFHFIRLDIVSNHGNPDYTIAYKLSVYGHMKRKNP